MKVDISRGKPVVDNRLKKITDKYFSECEQKHHKHCCCGHHHEGVEHNADHE